METSLTVRSALQNSSWILIPLVLSAFTHLWNPIGFPYTHADEGIYLQRSMYVLRALGPHESHPDSVLYDHPYFGQLFLAGVFKVIGYPDSLNAKPGDVHSIEMLYMVPRVLMGLLAVVDTFLIYKIAEVRYDRKVAFIASILFAVMPITWLTRWIFLDNIQLPLLLLSILFAAYYMKKNSSSISTTIHADGEKNNNNNIPLVILSGIFLGLAIFTKIPAFTMIPLVGYLIISSSSSSATTKNKKDKNNQNNNNTGTSSKVAKKRLRRTNTIITTNLRNLNLKALGLWFIPVILIPAIWPAYAISVGQLNEWIAGVLWQATERPNYKTLFNSLNDFFKIDPLLLVLGISGIVFATVTKKRNDIFFFLLWIIPFLIFLYVVGYVSLFHLIPLIPVFCITAAITIADLLNRFVVNYTSKAVVVKQTLSLFVIVSAIGIFGLISTSMLVTTNRNSSFFEVYAFIVQHLPNKISVDDKINNDKVTMIGNNHGTGAGVWSFSWIPKYVFQKDFEFTGISHVKVKTEKVILIADSRFLRAISDDHSDSKKGELLRSLYDDATTTVKVFKENGIRYPSDQYPYASISYNNNGIGRIEIRANY